MGKMPLIRDCAKLLLFSIECIRTVAVLMLFISTCVAGLLAMLVLTNWPIIMISIAYGSGKYADMFIFAGIIACGGAMSVGDFLRKIREQKQCWPLCHLLPEWAIPPNEKPYSWEKQWNIWWMASMQLWLCIAITMLAADVLIGIASRSRGYATILFGLGSACYVWLILNYAIGGNHTSAIPIGMAILSGCVGYAIQPQLRLSLLRMVRHTPHIC